ncbi:ABC-type Fe3+-siderophore transport system, permease component [Paenibacillus tianmuensis]|uniref:ABC-type Fe3+-siderophore transport system, permease component n=1 Tax=Paenibacillus tianmuensis TaxID=624147 RepID=A0A1G4TWG0_9BACL|nr:iron ABC transporter permease [Paenibacillus tianmuensis]SCW85658.1 ABC-type Fe3+-siderophore transport system, permease component [Paenibacillus tianmuensis]
MTKQRYTVKRGIAVIGILLFLIVLFAVISVNSGKMNLSPLEVWNVLLGKGTAKQNLIVFDFRLPRIVLSILVGLGMGAAGVVMQSLLRNDMASPGTLGISSGSGLFVLIFVVYFASLGTSSFIALPLLAFVGGMMAAGLIFLLSYRRGREISPIGLILTGVALGSGYGALTTFLTLKLDDSQMDFMLRWLAGSLWGDDWSYISVLAPWVLVLLGYIFYKARMLNTLHLGNQTAEGLGLAVKPEFLGLSIAAVALSSGSVAVGGSFFFIGLIAPHMARKLVGPDHKLLVPTASLAGGLIVVLADIITHTLSLGGDVPTGIVITVISVPYFLYLLAKAN